MNKEEANISSTDFKQKDIKHLEKMNEMKKKKYGKTSINIMLSKINTGND